jgi:hypothetical protein
MATSMSHDRHAIWLCACWFNSSQIAVSCTALSIRSVAIRVSTHSLSVTDAAVMNGRFAPIVLKKSFFAMTETSQESWCVSLAAM